MASNLGGILMAPFKFGRGIVHSLSGEARVHVEPLEAIELELALLWSR
ncbi:hypothetical protein [Archangium violaceum]